MKWLALLLFVCGLTLAQELAPANFNIRFEPTAKLQTEAPIPFQITVTDALHNPVIGATVTLQIETPQHTNVKVFKAPALDQIANPGVYVAKPVFGQPGTWNVYVEARRNNRMTARTIEFSVPRSTE